MRTRKAIAADVSEATGLLNKIIRIGGTTAYEEMLGEEDFTLHFLSGSNCLCCYVCETEIGELAGFQALAINENLKNNWADIATFARVAPKIKGVGTQLFGSTCDFARTAGVQVINATIRADNISGLSYYSKLGFVDYQIDKAIPMKDGTPVDRVSKKYYVV